MVKPPFSNAPDFQLPTANASFCLHDLEGRNRVALLFAPDEQTASVAVLQLEKGRENWRERDLILVLVMQNETALIAPQAVFIAWDEGGEVARRYGVSVGETAFFLLGKSRFPVALAVDYLPDDAELFALIDAMPMRQNEMRQRSLRSFPK